jgi:putative pyruvate formate lyase activating enzyme
MRSRPRDPHSSRHELFEPAYHRLGSEEIAARADRARAALAHCTLCPRRCGVDRLADERGVCATGRHARVASAGPHFGEEDCLVGHGGSGTLFFCGCNLGCVFCQNHDISQGGAGTEVTASELAELMLSLQQRGCENLNLVTPTHVVPQVLEALALAVPRGLRLPIVHNGGGYERVRTLRWLDEVVDVYMPDLKVFEEGTAEHLLGARDYPERAREALGEMQRQVGPLRRARDGVARRGLLVRHLVLPGQEEQRHAIFEWIAEELDRDTWVNVMGQYRPAHRVVRDESSYAEIDRPLTGREWKEARRTARGLGLWRLEES